MTYTKKQAKITTIFRKAATSKPPEDSDELQKEVQQLEEKLREKQNELFQIQRNSCRKRAIPAKNKDAPYVRPQKIIVASSLDAEKHNMELISMLTGVEVQSYVIDDHCCIVYHMQHNSDRVVKHGLRINMNSDGNEVTESSLPHGFNLKAVVEDFDNIMVPKCLGAIRKALVAFYDRQMQYESLKKLVNIEAELFRVLDSTHIEIKFLAQSRVDDEDEEDEQLRVTLILDYRIYDIRPKSYCFKENALPEGVSDVLREQCSVFKKKPLRKAFKEAFVDGVGAYRLARQLGVQQPERSRPRKRLRPNNYDYNNDDTFRPEDCSDPGEDAECYSE